MKNGSITAFLSLIMLLVLAMIGSVLECARIDVAQNYGKRVLSCGADSLLTEYYLPLYEDYHLFFLEKGIDTDSLEKEKLLESIKVYMEYSFSPSKEKNAVDITIPPGTMNLFQMSIENMNISNIVRITDYEGGIFENEAVEYMKYKGITNGAEVFLNKLKVLKKAEKTSIVLEKKMQSEESMAQCSETIMEFIKYVEGISYKKSGIQWDKHGLIKTEKNFAKKFCPKEITKYSVGVEHDLVWSSLKNKYQNPIQYCNDIKKDISKIQEIKKLINESEEELEEMKTSDKLEDQKEIKNQKERLEEMEEQKKELKVIFKNIKNSRKKIVNEADGIQEKIKAAIKLIPGIQKKQVSIQKDLKEYKDVLEQNKNEMIPNLYQNLKEDYDNMNQYIGIDEKQMSVISNIIHMKSRLEKNQNILESVKTLQSYTITDKDKDLEALKEAVEVLTIELEKYEIQTLKFDYSGLKIKENVTNPVDKMKNSLNGSILELVIKDSKNISEKKISKEDTLYKEYIGQNKSAQKDLLNKDYSDVLKTSKKKGYQNEYTTSFHDFSDLCKTAVSASEGAEQFGRALLLNEYFLEHFKSYRNQTEKKIKRKTALEYEQEYILVGKKSDKENIQGVVNRIIFIRTILNFMYILTDAPKKKIAYSTAASVIGFTGVEPLVRLTQMLILLTWCFEEALVDTAGILNGKEVPLLKDKSTFLLKYSDLLVINKSLVQKKAEQISKKNSGIVSLGYEDFIRIFLFMEHKVKKSYRALDLIETNMQLCHAEIFCIKRCMFGLEVSADMTITSKFLKLPFVMQGIESDIKGWRFSFKQSFSY